MMIDNIQVNGANGNSRKEVYIIMSLMTSYIDGMDIKERGLCD
jgi:hypothetical protein